MMDNLSIDSTAETPAQAVETHASWHGNTTMEMERAETPAQAVETYANSNTTMLQHARREEDRQREDSNNLTMIAANAGWHNQSYQASPPLLYRPKPPLWLFPPPRTHDAKKPTVSTDNKASPRSHEEEDPQAIMIAANAGGITNHTDQETDQDVMKTEDEYHDAMQIEPTKKKRRKRKRKKKPVPPTRWIYLTPPDDQTVVTDNMTHTKAPPRSKRHNRKQKAKPNTTSNLP
jgi:hypothetical protein